MNKIKNYLLFFIVIITFNGCNQFGDLFKSAGPITTEERHLPTIDKIELYNDVDVVIHYASIYRMTVTAGSHLLGKIETNFDGNKLIIRNKNKFNWVRKFNPTLVVDIWVPSISNMMIFNGTGNISCADTLVAPIFELNSYGSLGNYNLILKCSTSYLKIHNGPADINVSGITNLSYIYAAGDGKINGENYIADETDITDESINDIKVYANDKLNVTLQSIGNIYYKGTPTQLITKITGSGKLIPL